MTLGFSVFLGTELLYNSLKSFEIKLIRCTESMWETLVHFGFPVYLFVLGVQNPDCFGK